MYKVKPYEDNIIIKCVPSCVYKTKCYFNPNDLKFKDEVVSPMANLSLSELEDLTKQQNKQFRKLERLVNKSNELCDDLKLSDLCIQNLSTQNSELSKLENVFQKQETLFKKIESLNQKVRQTYEEMGLNKLTSDFEKMDIKKKKRIPFKVDLGLFEKIKRVSSRVLINRNVEDLAIYVEPSTIPMELLNFIDLLSQNVKVFTKFYVHSSVFSQLNNELENRFLNIDDLFEGLRFGINDNRVDYDLGFTFIWKKMESNGPMLRFSNGSFISSNAQIVNYVNELLPQVKRISEENLKKNQTTSPLLKVLKSF